MDKVHERPRDGDGDREIAAGNAIEGNRMKVGIEEMARLEGFDAAKAADDFVEGL